MIRDGKRFSFIAVLFFSFCVFLSAQDSGNTTISWFTNEMPELSAQWGYSVPFKKDLRQPSAAEDFIIAADFRELRIDTGIKYQFNQLDITNRAVYMPTFNNSFQAGFGLCHHFYRYTKTFTENDIIVSTRFRWIKGPVFLFENAAGFLFKFATIDAVCKNTPCIFNLSYQFELLCKWQLNPSFDFWCAVNLQDYFDYPLAISPFYKIGMNVAVRKELLLGMDYTLKFVDMFYSAVYLNEQVLRFTVKVRL